MRPRMNFLRESSGASANEYPFHAALLGYAHRFLT